MDLSNLEPRPLYDYSSVELAGHLTHCFEDYVAPFKLEGPQFDARFRPESLDSAASSVWMLGDKVAAVSLIARRGWTCRLAAMAVAKEFRGQGFGKSVMEREISSARERGDRTFLLEVIEQNPPAIGLYERVGFEKRRRLVGYSRPASGGTPAALTEIDPLELVRLMVSECDLDVPWDFWPETLCAKAPPTKAWSLDGDSFALVTNAPARAVLWALFTVPQASRQGKATRLIDAVAALSPDKPIVTPVAIPDQLAPGFFAKCGFEEGQISQFEMIMELM